MARAEAGDTPGALLMPAGDACCWPEPLYHVFSSASEMAFV